MMTIKTFNNDLELSRFVLQAVKDKVPNRNGVIHNGRLIYHKRHKPFTVGIYGGRYIEPDPPVDFLIVLASGISSLTAVPIYDKNKPNAIFVAYYDGANYPHGRCNIDGCVIHCASYKVAERVRQFYGDPDPVAPLPKGSPSTASCAIWRAIQQRIYGGVVAGA